jgi:hypothetical protein
MTEVSKKTSLLTLFAFLLFIQIACSSQTIPPAPLISAEATTEMVDFSRVRPIFNARCVACHSCLESPCELNMQAWQGLRRGAFHEGAYDGARVKAVPPQRMFEDAQTELQWRARGFIDVLDGGQDSIFLKTLRLSELDREAPTTEVRYSEICPQDPKDVTASNKSELAMPYGLPALTTDQERLLERWVLGGAKGDMSREANHKLPAEIEDQVQDWTHFLNAQDLKSQIVARYLYEHLFLAHLYFKEQPRTFFRLIRSSTSCEAPTPVATNRPNEDPGTKNWFYCLTQDPMTIVFKNHIPYELGSERLAWLKKNFFTQDWTPKEFPSFEFSVAGNPLLAFKDIPVEARFRFLLQDAQYEVATFIKGPVCNGSFAVNSIQEQFYVFFMNPKSDLMVRSRDFENHVAPQLVLPGSLGANLSLSKIISGYKNILTHRAQAKREMNQELKREFPQGLSVQDIWDGDGVNPNAVLTVFRHDDNAKVYQGARGDLSKTSFVLDYSTFERLVYNLVINFDVFDNVSHQLLTRLYMDILRMDAEDRFVQFLPPKARAVIKDAWYRGFTARLKMDLIDEKEFADIPGARELPEGGDAKLAFVQEILFNHLKPEARGPVDSINWKVLHEEINNDPIESQLKHLASVRARKKISPFPNFFPELSFLIVTDNGRPEKMYSILRNREHQSLSWILAEKYRLAPEEDTLTILPGAAGAYPNQFFTVDKIEVMNFVSQAMAIKNKKQYQNFLDHFGVARMSNQLWPIYDFANSYLEKAEPVGSGVLDLSRYAL